MKTKGFKTILTTVLALAMSVFCLAGCNGAPAGGGQSAEGGILRLSVNPEIAVAYDSKGIVTSVEGRNEDGKNILANYTEYVGKEARSVVAELVAAIGEAGYFVEEVEGVSRQITIEIEPGSSMPHQTFFDEVVADIQDCVTSNEWHSPVVAIDHDIDDDTDDLYDDHDDDLDDVNDDLDDVNDDLDDVNDDLDDVNDDLNDVNDDLNDVNDDLDDVNDDLDDVNDDLNDVNDDLDDVNDDQDD